VSRCWSNVTLTPRCNTCIAGGQADLVAIPEEQTAIYKDKIIRLLSNDHLGQGICRQQIDGVIGSDAEYYLINILYIANAAID
jgi:hypothetical protein